MDPLDVPYDQPVPLPACWVIPSQPKDGSPNYRTPSHFSRCRITRTPWPFVLLAIYICYATALWTRFPKLSQLHLYDTSPTLHRILYPAHIGSHRLLTVNVEDAQNYLQILTTNLPSIRNNTVFAAASEAQNLTNRITPMAVDFTHCHNRLVDDYKGTPVGHEDCGSLYMTVSTCNTRLLSYLFTYDQLVSSVNQLGLAMSEEISHIQKWEAGRSDETKQQLRSPSGRLKDLKQLIFGGSTFDNVQDPADRAIGEQGRRAKKALIGFHSELKQLCMLDPAFEATRKAIKDTYSKVLETFLQNGCGEPGVTCLCKGDDLAAVGSMLEISAVQASHFQRK